MAIDPSLPFRILQPPTAINPDDLPGGVNWQAKRAEADALKLKAQQQRQDFLDRQQLRAVLTKNGGDIEKSIPELSAINPELGMKLQSEWTGIKDKRQKFESSRMELWRNYEDHIAQANNQDEFAKALLAIPDSDFRKKYEGAQWSPELKQAAEAASMAPSVREQRRVQAAEAASKEADRLEDNKRQAQAEVNRHEETLARIRDMADDNKRQQAQADEAARHNRSMEAIQAQTANRMVAAQQETARHNRAVEEGADPASAKNQSRLEQQYRTVLQRTMSSRSGGLGLEDQKVNQALHLLSIFDQNKDKNGNYAIPRVMQNELALGLARLISPNGNVGVQLEQELNQRTAAGDFAGVVTYLTGQPVTGNTQAVLKMFRDSIERQGKVAQQNRETYLDSMRALAPTDLAEERRLALEKSLNLNRLPETTPAPSPAGTTAGIIYARDPKGVVHQAKAGTPLPAGWVQVEKP